MLAIIARFWL